jgi:hypothetical protein
MGVDYACEKFTSALHYAVGSSVSVQQRLEGVMQGVGHLDRNDFADDETWERFKKLLAETTKLPAQGNEGTITATTSKMSDEEAAKWLRVAFELYSDITEQYAKQTR